MDDDVTSPRAVAIVEELAAAVVLARAGDDTALAELAALLSELSHTLPAATPEWVRERVQASHSVVELVQQEACDATDCLAALAEDIADLQLALGRASVSPGEEPGRVDFLASLRPALEELEALARGIERAPETLPELRRRLHTLKGEAGVVGLADLAQVFHGIEDLFASTGSQDRPGGDWCARLLTATGWLSSAGAAHARHLPPDPPASHILDLLAEQPEVAVSGDGVRAPLVERDEETVALLGEFFQESGEGLARVDQILINVETEGDPSAEDVNGVLRVFHTIKGVSGFLELTDLTALAHAAETVLKGVQEGSLELGGATIDLLLDATATARRLLEAARQAVARGEAFCLSPDLPSLLAEMEAAQVRAPEPELPAVQPGMKLGEILERTAAVSREQIDSALEGQRRSGLRLGEELVAQGLVEAKAVAHALRAQRQCELVVQPKLREMVKVDLEYLDNLVETIGELVIVESMLVNLPEVSSARSSRARGQLAQLAKITRDLQGAGLRLRMVPVRGAFQKMTRLVRDLARKSGKRVRLILSGEGTEMDCNLVERLADPLVHMIRNAMDHGIEPSEERQRCGKPAVGGIWLSAFHEGGSIVIEVRDDGRGLDRAAILAKARGQGLVREGETLGEAEVLELIFVPGFSTAARVTEISGRGVGMDVVKSTIQAMRGRVQVASTPGEGTTFRVVLPLTLSIIDGMLVRCGHERYVLPALAVRESLRPTPSMIVTYSGERQVLALRGELLPLLRLDQLLGVPGSSSVEAIEGLVVILETSARTLALAVDDVLVQQQVVIKPLGDWLAGTRLVAGATILFDGRVGLILDPEAIGLEGTVQAPQPSAERAE